MTVENLTLTVRCEKTLLYKTAFPFILLLIKTRLISLSTAVKLGNYVLDKGAFKIKIDDGKWSILKGVGRLEVEDFA